MQQILNILVIKNKEHQTSNMVFLKNVYQESDHQKMPKQNTITMSEKL